MNITEYPYQTKYVSYIQFPVPSRYFSVQFRFYSSVCANYVQYCLLFCFLLLCPNYRFFGLVVYDVSMSAGSGDVQEVGNERGAGFIGRGSRRGRISGALIQGVFNKVFVS